MTSFTLTNKKLLESKAQCLVFFVEQDFKFSKEFIEFSNKFFPNLKKFIKDKKFTGMESSKLLIPISIEAGVTNLLFIGLGKPKKAKKIDIENFRRALGYLIRISEKHHFKSMAFKIRE